MLSSIIITTLPLTRFSQHACVDKYVSHFSSFSLPQNLVPDFKKAATALKGIVKVGAVDMTQHQSVGAKYDIKGFPTIKIFGLNKNSPVDYNNERSAKGIASAALKEVREVVSARLKGNAKPNTSSSSSSSSSSSGSGSGSGKDGEVLELSSSNFDKEVFNNDAMYLVSFTAPWCGHCQRLKPEWKSAAFDLRNNKNIKFANVDCTQNEALCGRFGVRGYPTIKAFRYGSRKSSSGESYDSERSSASIVTYVKNALERDLPPPAPVELLSATELAECAKQSVCAIAVLPHILDSSAKERTQYIERITAAMAKTKTLPVAWVYTYAGTHKALENVLDMGGSGYPAFAVASIGKKKFAPMFASFSAENIRDFVEDVVRGRETVRGINGKEFPTLATVAKWDGKDAEKQEL